jgi:hypothetical protein
MTNSYEPEISFTIVRQRDRRQVSDRRKFSRGGRRATDGLTGRPVDAIDANVLSAQMDRNPIVAKRVLH